MTAYQTVALVAYGIAVVAPPFVPRLLLAPSNQGRTQLFEAGNILLNDSNVSDDVKQAVRTILNDPVSPWLVFDLMRECRPSRIAQSPYTKLRALGSEKLIGPAARSFWNATIMTAVASKPVGAVLFATELMIMAALRQTRVQARAWLSELRASLRMVHFPSRISA